MVAPGEETRVQINSLNVGNGKVGYFSDQKTLNKHKSFCLVMLLRSSYFECLVSPGVQDGIECMGVPTTATPAQNR
jgi:hypothetical protein